ncbi:sensor protein LytS [Paenibacillus sp. J31TS4]|uniref:LytS/YhcK type 5TM receptor domain-containing protein n=1 Tax=Paenibacillus sp. J31TS4 TaxID=2807195 RepID=UPI001B143625|nr:LytS/YhcK type 5TM receptor domain-containing protein [Paenibacillus sp. J31TS4]GIP36905.1 sensor protein LytS [Paenibacillus sp. J31TS4]
MKELTLVLLERNALLLLVFFLLTRIPLFRKLIDREPDGKHWIPFSLLFGLFSVMGTYAGVRIEQDLSLMTSFWIPHLRPDEAIAGSSLVGVIMGGLLGGQRVGMLAGLLSGAHLLALGGATGIADALTVVLVGWLSGWITKQVQQPKVLSPTIAFYIGFFAVILHYSIVLIVCGPTPWIIAFVDTVGIPMVLTTSASVSIFMMMLLTALREKEAAAATETERALHIAELALPHLKQGLSFATAEATAQLLKRELKAAAVAITDTERVLAYVGTGSSAHEPGEPIASQLSLLALESGRMQIARQPAKLDPRYAKLGAVIVVPFQQGGRVAGLIHLYFRSPERLRRIEIVLAEGLGKLISYQLEASLSEQLARHMKESELRMLQAQINPHFLFNTLNSIVTLIRTDPDLARHATVQLATFMRLSLQLTNAKLVTLRQELDHLKAYLDIMQIRFADRFTVSLMAEEGLAGARLPPATFQPLVENCIQHGLKDKQDGGFIAIYVTEAEGMLKATIEDNGTGIPEAVRAGLGDKPVQEGKGTGIGVYNVNQRLLALFGPGAGLDIGERPGGGTRIRFAVPLHSSEVKA